MEKRIDIQEQPVLGLGRTAGLTLNGIRYRLFRSMVTVVVIAVAMAFLTNILSEGMIKRAIARDTKAEIAQIRQAVTWAARLSAPPSLEEVLASAADQTAPSYLFPEMTNLGGLGAAEAAEFWRGAKTATGLALYFEDPVEDFDRLLDEVELKRFTLSLDSPMPPLFPKKRLRELEAFLEKWPGIRKQAVAIQEGYAGAIRKVQTALAGRQVIKALEDANGRFGQAVIAAGFHLHASAPIAIADQARQIAQKRLLEQSVLEPELRKLLAARLDVLPTDVSPVRLWKLLRSERGAGWYREQLKEEDARTTGGLGLADFADLDVARMMTLAEREKRERSLMRAERMQMGDQGGIMGIGKRMSWLVFVSMLVCVVGITNAMLMSVTERFREIATLKCLGALDGFIMLMFVMEACVLGIVGGVMGAIAGNLIGTARMLISFGGLVFGTLPVGDLFLGAGIALCVSVVLAAIASVYPSFKAAKLAPMEAMRIE